MVDARRSIMPSRAARSTAAVILPRCRRPPRRLCFLGPAFGGNWLRCGRGFFPKSPAGTPGNPRRLHLTMAGEPKSHMATINTLQELLVDELRDLYDAENQLVKALPKMAKAATNEKLREGFSEHLEQTKGHVQRLERAFELLDEKPKSKTCKAMKG